MTISTQNANAIISLRPGAAWTMQNDDLSTLIWLDQTQTRPTNTEISTEAARILGVGSVPQTISDRQFFQHLAGIGIITNDDALQAVKTGFIPAPLQTLINGLPSAQQFAATMLVAGETSFHRYHWLTIAIGSAYGWTATQIDQFFQAAAAL